MKEKAEAGELDCPGAAFAILQRGMQISFFRCEDDKVTGLGLGAGGIEDILILIGGRTVGTSRS